MITEKIAEEIAMNTNYISNIADTELMINDDKRQLISDAKEDLNCKYL